MKEVKLPIEWIERLKYYTDRVQNAGKFEKSHEMAVYALLGYLDSLDTFLSETNK